MVPMRWRRFVLLPTRGLRSRGADPATGWLAAASSRGARVLDTLATGADGAALVAVPQDEVGKLRRSVPGARLVPVRRYRPALFRPDVVGPVARTTTREAPMEVRVVSASASMRPASSAPSCRRW